MSEPVACLPVAWIDKSGAPRSLTALMEDNFAGWLYSADAIERNDAAIAELIGALREYIESSDGTVDLTGNFDAAMLRFNTADDAARAAIAKYDTKKVVTT